MKKAFAAVSVVLAAAGIALAFVLDESWPFWLVVAASLLALQWKMGW
jgi:hypothetical protein